MPGYETVNPLYSIHCQEYLYKEAGSMYLKKIRFDLSRVYFGCIDSLIHEAENESARNKVLSDAYNHLSAIGVYPEGTVFGCNHKWLICRMPEVSGNDAEQHEMEYIIDQVKSALSLKAVYTDLMHPHNYRRDNRGILRLIDLEIFPLKIFL